MKRRDEPELPAVELIDGEPSIQTTQQVMVGRRLPGKQSRARLLIGLAAAAMVLVGFATWGDDGEPSASLAEEASTTTPRPTTTTTRGTTTLPTTTTLPSGPVLPEPTGALLLVFGNNRWTLVDLDTGTRTRADDLGSQYYGGVAVTGGIVFIDDTSGEAVHHALTTLTDDEADPVVLGQADSVFRATRPDQVWLLNGGPNYSSGGSAQPTTLRLVDLDGTVQRTISLQAEWVAGVTDDGAVVVKGGRIFMVDESGARAIATGDLVDVDGDHLLARICDERARCHFELRDLARGTAADVDLPESLFTFGVEMVSTPDGRVALLSYQGEGVQGRLWLIDADGVVVDLDPSNASGPPMWLPKGLGVLLVLSAQELGWLRIGEDGSPATEELPGLADLRVEVAYLIER